MASPPTLKVTFIVSGQPLGEWTLSATDENSTLLSLLEASTGIPTSYLRFTRGGVSVQLDPSAPISASGLSNGDLVVVADVRAGSVSGADGGASGGAATRIRGLKGMFQQRVPIPPSEFPNLDLDAMRYRRATPDEWHAAARVNAKLKAQLSRDVEFSSALEQPTPDALRMLIERRIFDSAIPEATRTADISRAHARLAVDPCDVSAQKVIEDEINRANVDRNRDLAFDVLPESFTHIDMLYIQLLVNGVKCIALVDTGAQSTIISSTTAVRCNIGRLIDTREAGMARGVGTGVIVGKVHLAPLQIGAISFSASFTVMEKEDMDFLLGLDFLRRFGAVIDIPRNVLCLKIDDSTTEVPFMSSREISKFKVHGSDAPRSPTTGGGSDDFPSTPMEEVAANGGGGGGGASATASGAAAPSAPLFNLSSLHGPGPTAQPAQSAAPLFNLSSLRGPGPTAQPAPSAAVDAVCAIGYSREQATDALARTGGNVDAAIALLLEQG